MGIQQAVCRVVWSSSGPPLLQRGFQQKPGRIPTSTLQTQSGKARIAREVMNSDVVSVSIDATIQEAVETMLSTGRKVLPVLDRQGHVQGVVSRADLLQLPVEG